MKVEKEHKATRSHTDPTMSEVSFGAFNDMTREFAAERVNEVQQRHLATPQIDPRPIVETVYSSEEGYDGEAVDEMPDFVEIMFDQENSNLEEAFGIQVQQDDPPEPEGSEPGLSSSKSEEESKSSESLDDDEVTASRRMPDRRRIHFDDTTPTRYVTNHRSTMGEIMASAVQQQNRFARAGGTTMPTRPTLTLIRFGSPSSRFQFATTQRTSKLTPKSVKQFKTVTIDGRPLTIKSTPTDVNCLQPVLCTWNKLDCKDLDSKTKQLFVKSATGYVLTRSNKLTVFSMQDTDDDKLKQLNLLQTQLKLLRAQPYAEL
jgi:hypothetical protein